jgi:hypothetical protein
MIFDWQYLFDALKKQGLTAILLGAYIWVQQRDIDKMREEQIKENEEMKAIFRSREENFERRLLDCENARIEELKQLRK